MSKKNTGCLAYTATIVLATILSNFTCLFILFTDAENTASTEFKWLAIIAGNFLALITASIAYAISPYFISSKDKLLESAFTLWGMRLIPTIMTHGVTLILILAIVPKVLEFAANGK
jgi:hypothetical protein